MYANGQGVPQDYAEAVKWYRKAAEQGDATAQSNLGVMYEKGQGVPQDYAEAVKWWRKAAAEQGNAFAQSNLGTMYANGRGVPQNYVQAHVWFNLAAANARSIWGLGDAIDFYDAVKNRDIVAGKMTPAQIAQAQEMARKCQASNYKKCE